MTRVHFLLARRRFANILDRPSVRLVLAIVVGLPITAYSVVFGLLGLLVIFRMAAWPAYLEFIPLLGPIVLGLLGVAGGWIRLLRRHSTMGATVRRSTVSLLSCGVIGALWLTGFQLFGETMLQLEFVLAWAAMAAIGVLLILATPSPVEEEGSRTVARPHP